MSDLPALPRRDLLRIAAGSVLGGGWLRAVAADPPPETTRIRIQDAPIACFAPLYIAQALLQAEGFTQVEYVTTSMTTGPGLLLGEGKLDIIQDDTAAHLMNLER